MSVLLVPFRFGGTGVITGKRLVAFSAARSVRVVLFWFGIGPRGSVETRRDAPAGPLDEAPVDGVGDAEWVALALALAVGEAERVALAVAVGLEDADRVGLALGLGDPERLGVAVAVGLGEAERVGLALAVGVGVGDADWVGLVLAVGVGTDVDGEAEGDADVDGDGAADPDGLDALEALVLAAAEEGELVLAAAEEGEGDGELDGWLWEATVVTTLAYAEPCMPTDSPETRKPPVTRPATTARPRARDM